MGRVSDEERRDVAARLRKQADKLGPNMDAHEFANYTADVLDVDENMMWYGMELRLADLIEPEPERTCRDTSPLVYKFTCSECHSSYRFGSEHKVWYCPHCGAKLEGVGR